MSASIPASYVSLHTPGVPKEHLIHAEIVAVTSAMRKNARWSSTSTYAYARNAAKLNGSSMALYRNGAGAAVGGGGAGGMGAGTSRREPPRESDLMTAFDSLKRDVSRIEDVSELPLPTLLNPFIDLLRSSFCTGPIAVAVLSAIRTFFTYELITPSGVDIKPALVELSDALARLRFEASDPASDEVVSLQLLKVIELMMCSPVGASLGDVEVCELLESVLTICCQMRRAEVLRRSAEVTMHTIVRVVSARLGDLDPKEAEDQLERDEEAERIRTEGTEGAIEASAASDTVDSPESGATRPRRDTDANIAMTGTSTPAPTNNNTNLRPFGLLSVRELLRVVVNLLDPTDPAHTDSIRLTALGIITASLTICLPHLAAFKRSLLPIITDSCCKYLFQLVASADEIQSGGAANHHMSMLILERSLRVIGMLIGEESLRSCMKLQVELFLSFVMDRLAPPPAPATALNGGAPNLQLGVGGGKGGHAPKASNLGRAKSPTPGPDVPSRSSMTLSTAGAPEGEDEDAAASEAGSSNAPPRLGVLPARGETRELLMEALVHIAVRQPSFVPDLWVNYDCDLNCEDVFDKLVKFLTTDAGAVPNYTSQLMSLDLLLSLVNHMASRAENPPPEDQKLPQTSEMLALKEQKKLLLAGTARFNVKPKKGLTFLEEKGLLTTAKASNGTGESRNKSLATFLKKSPRLDKKLLGEYISRTENADVLREFIGLYDFRGKSVADALRELLESFRLPGEAQQIDRITSTFAECFFATGPEEIKTQDAVYVLAFAVIMLNTDQHSPNIRKRMTFEDFQRNLRGVNGTVDFEPEYLRGIFDSIKKREIIMPQEHTGQAGFDYAWKELMNRSQSSEPLMTCNTARFDETIFKLTWRSIVNAIANAFTTFDDELVVQDVIAGFRQCATLAAKFQLPEVFDFLVSSLSRATGLLGDNNSNITPGLTNFPIVEVDTQKVTVSPLSIRLGTSFRGQMAAVVLFTIANGNGTAIRDGWAQIFSMFQTLFLHSLLPAKMVQAEDFLGGASTIPLQGNASSPVVTTGRNDGGLLFTLSSYLMTPYAQEAAVPEVTDRDIESTMSAIDCIAACRLDELYLQIPQLDVRSLVSSIKALVELADRRTLQPLQLEYEEEDDRSQRNSRPLPYDPSSVFLLETMISLTLRTEDKIEDIWPVVFPHISSVLSSAPRFSVLLIERAVVGLLRVTLILAAKPNLRDQLYIALDLLNGLPATTLSAVAEQLVAGLSLLIKEHRDAISSPTEWSLVFALVRVAAPHYVASKPAFALVSEIVSQTTQNPASWTDSLAGLVAILEEFSIVPSRALMNRNPRRQNQAQEAVSLQQGNLERGVQAIDHIWSLRAAVPAWIEKSSNPPMEAWKSGWNFVLLALGRQSSALSPEIRHASINNLQRILLGPQLLQQPDVVDPAHVFFNVVFPMLDDVLSPELDEHRGKRELLETRLRASTLLCKSFLQLEVGAPSAHASKLREIWLILLDFMERLMMSGGRQDQLYEAVPESLKNVILVMNASDILVHPPPMTNDTAAPPASGQEDERVVLWNETQDRLEGFLPGLLHDLLPPPPSPAPTEQTVLPNTEEAPVPAQS
ncbi:Sec7-domain-containing protein [Clavulina sp. PMI_390]|nr:Sec7-domain-containing protein [Clavulina sp. PMI_390]